MVEYWFRLCLWRMLKLNSRVGYSCWLQILCFLSYVSTVLIVPLRDGWVYPFLVEVWHSGRLRGWIRRTPWLSWVLCYSNAGFKIAQPKQVNSYFGELWRELKLELKGLLFLFLLLIHSWVFSVVTVYMLTFDGTHSYLFHTMFCSAISDSELF